MLIEKDVQVWLNNIKHNLMTKYQQEKNTTDFESFMVQSIQEYRPL
jgi:hypothetical protein